MVCGAHCLCENLFWTPLCWLCNRVTGNLWNCLFTLTFRRCQPKARSRVSLWNVLLPQSSPFNQHDPRTGSGLVLVPVCGWFHRQTFSQLVCFSQYRVMSFTVYVSISNKILGTTMVDYINSLQVCSLGQKEVVDLFPFKYKFEYCTVGSEETRAGPRHTMAHLTVLLQFEQQGTAEWSTVLPLMFSCLKELFHCSYCNVELKEATSQPLGIVLLLVKKSLTALHQEIATSQINNWIPACRNQRAS